MIFCVNQRQCCFIIAYFVLISRSLKLIFNTGTLVPLFIVHAEIKKYGDGDGSVLKSLIAILTGEVVIAFLDIISTIILIVGLHKKNCKLILIYLVTTMVFFLLGSLCLLSGAGASAWNYDGADWFRFTCEILYKCVYMYCVYLIHKYYVKLCEREEDTCEFNKFDEISKPDEES